MQKLCYNSRAFDGRLAQLGEHLPYKQRVTGSSPVLSTIGKVRRKVLDAQTARRGAVLNDNLNGCQTRGRPSAQFARESSPVLSTIGSFPKV